MVRRATSRVRLDPHDRRRAGHLRAQFAVGRHGRTVSAGVAAAARRGRPHGFLRDERLPDHGKLGSRPASGAVRGQTRLAVVAAHAHGLVRHGAGRRSDDHDPVRRRLLRRPRHLGLHRQQRRDAHPQTRTARCVRAQPLAECGEWIAVDAADGAACLRRSLCAAVARRREAPLPLADGRRPDRAHRVGSAPGATARSGVGGFVPQRADRVAGGVPGRLRLRCCAEPVPDPAVAAGGRCRARGAGADAQQHHRVVLDGLRGQLRRGGGRAFLAVPADGAGRVGQRQLRRVRVGLPDPAVAGDGRDRQPMADADLRGSAGLRLRHAVVDVHRRADDETAALRQPGTEEEGTGTGRRLQRNRRFRDTGRF